MLRTFKEIVRPAWWKLLRLAHPRGRRLNLNGEIVIAVDPGVDAGRSGRVDYEAEYFHQFLEQVRPGATVYDIGANQGFFAIAAGMRAGIEGAVYAFEPAPPALDLLTRQIALNHLQGVVVAVNSLVGSVAAESVPFHVAKTAVGWASAAYQPPGTTRIQVSCTTVDRFVSECGRPPALMKIDVEGFELEVLRGAVNTLSHHRPAVFCALHPEFLAKRGTSSAEVIELMRGLRYSATDPNGSAATGGTLEVIFLPEPRT